MNQTTRTQIAYTALLLVATLLTGGAWTLVILHADIHLPLFTTPLPWAIGLTATLPLLIGKLYRTQRQYDRQVLFLLDAVENNDYSIRFPEDDRNNHAYFVNSALNRIVHLLYNVKKETVQQEKYYELILVAAQLDITRQTLYNKMKKYGL